MKYNSMEKYLINIIFINITIHDQTCLHIQLYFLNAVELFSELQCNPAVNGMDNKLIEEIIQCKFCLFKFLLALKSCFIFNYLFIHLFNYL